MLTLLRVRRAARLRRRPELDGASRPLHRAGSWQPSFSECNAGARAIFLRPSGRISISRHAVWKTPDAARRIRHAPRATDYESGGQEFESLRARQVLSPNLDRQENRLG